MDKIARLPYGISLTTLLTIILVLWPLNVLSGVSFGQKILYILFPIICLVFAIILTKGSIKVSPKIFLLVLFFIGFDFIGLILKFHSLTLNTVLEYVRPLINSTLLISAFCIGKATKIDAPKLRKILNTVLLICVIFIFLQLVVPDNPIIKSVSPRTIFGNLGIWIGGPFIWSYSFGVFLLIIYSMYLFDVFNGKSMRFQILVFTIIIFLMIFTQSKAVYLSAMFITLLAVVYKCSYRLNTLFLKRLILLLTAITVLCVYIFLEHLENLGNIARFVNFLITREVDASTASRLAQLEKIHLVTFVDWLFGAPSTGYEIENTYGYKLVNFGLLGVTTLLLQLTFIFLIALKMFRWVPASEYFAFFALSVSLPIFMLGSIPLDGPKIGYLVILLIGFWVASYENVKWQVEE